MAIYIKEESGKKSGGLFGFGLLFLVLVMIGVAVYYMFFVKPELISAVAPLQLQSIDQLAQIDFDPASVINSDFFKQLKQLVPPQTLKPAGNSSPFGVF